jgi:hypothetical protein
LLYPQRLFILLTFFSIRVLLPEARPVFPYQLQQPTFVGLPELLKKGPMVMYHGSVLMKEKGDGRGGTLGNLSWILVEQKKMKKT